MRRRMLGFLLAMILITPSAALAGDEAACTAPSEPGCDFCCRPLDNGMCTQLSWTGGPETKTKPWYNAQRALGKPCPGDCRPCARCLERDSDNLARMKAPEGCDCAAIEVGVDPCHAPMSCECFCSRWKRLTDLCGASASK